MVKTIIRVLVGGLLLTCAWATSLVLTRANTIDAPATQALVVLGSAQFDGRPQPVFENRLQHAATLYADAPVKVFTVGGKLPGDRFTEAQAGSMWLSKSGVNEADLISVPRGSDTWESLQAVAAVAKDLGITSMTVVSDPAHVARCQSMLKHLGIERVEVSPTQSGPGSELRVRYVARETLALIRFWVADVWFS